MDSNKNKGNKVSEPMAMTLKPYTLDELYARIEASEEDIRKGNVLTAQESREFSMATVIWTAFAQSPKNLAKRIK
jgi:hypothetical protein